MSLVKMAGLRLSNDILNEDRFTWGEGRKQILVSEVYKLSKDWKGDDQWEGWHKIWKLGVRQRVRVFVWLMSHGKPMTNFERWRWHIGSNAVCGRCLEEEEDVLHAIRVCVVAKEL